MLTFCWIESGRPPLDAAGQQQQGRIDFRLSIEVNDVRYAVNQAFQAGAAVIEEYETRSRYVALVRDLDGLMIELHEARFVSYLLDPDAPLFRKNILRQTWVRWSCRPIGPTHIGQVVVRQSMTLLTLSPACTPRRMTLLMGALLAAMVLVPTSWTSPQPAGGYTIPSKS